MIITDTGYALLQNVQANKLEIKLPQTYSTLTSTIEPVSSRKLMLSEAEESALLQIIIQLFESAHTVDCQKES